jgi:hypothetical protein
MLIVYLLRGKKASNPGERRWNRDLQKSYENSVNLLRHRRFHIPTLPRVNADAVVVLWSVGENNVMVSTSGRKRYRTPDQIVTENITRFSIL